MRGILFALLVALAGCHRAEAMSEDDPEIAEDEFERRHKEFSDRIQRDMDERQRQRDAERQAELEADAAKTRRIDTLANAMEQYIVHTYCSEPVRRCREDGHCPRIPGVRRHPELACRINPRQAHSIAEKRDLRGWASLLYAVVSDRVESDQWVPFGADDAPIWLASVSYHEFSWMWRNTTKRGSIGERCAFQVTEAPVELWRSQENRRRASLNLPLLSRREATAIITHEPFNCADAAIEWMHHCGEMCGGLDARGFLEVGESGIPKRRWRNITVRYRDASGTIKTHKESRYVVIPTGASRWMGAYASAPIRIRDDNGRVRETRPNCGGAPDIVRERFETAHWLRGYINEHGGSPSQ